MGTTIQLRLFTEKPALKTLLNDPFAPLTHQVGFLEATLEDVVAVFLNWQTKLGEPVGRKPSHERFIGSLPQALTRLDPLTTPPSKALFIETRSRWTALFENGLRSCDPENRVAYLSSIIPCKGVAAHCIPDRSKICDQEALRIYGAVSFTMFASHQTDWQNLERNICAMNDGGRWCFDALGVEQPFEEPEKYKARRVADRFTDQMLERYCEALDIKLFDETFYGTKAAVIRTIQQLPPGFPVMSLKDAQARTVSTNIR